MSRSGPRRIIIAVPLLRKQALAVVVLVVGLMLMHLLQVDAFCGSVSGSGSILAKAAPRGSFPSSSSSLRPIARRATSSIILSATKTADYSSSSSSSSGTLLQEEEDEQRIRRPVQDDGQRQQRQPHQSSSSSSSTTSSSSSSPSRLREIQERAGPVAASFRVADAFDPPRGWWSLWSNCHFQTIVGFLLRDTTWGNYVPSNMNSLEVAVRAIRALVLSSLASSSSSSSRSDGDGRDRADETTTTTTINNIAETTMVANDGDIGKRSTAAAGDGGGGVAGITIDPIQVDFWDRRERIDTPDGDWFHADSKFVVGQQMTEENSKEQEAGGGGAVVPVVIMLHGLASSSMSSLSIDMARAFVAAGMDCVCLNFRGCSGVPNDTLGAYHVGFTDDLIHYLSTVITSSRRRRRPENCPVYLAGFSLGANVVLKCLGDLGERVVTDYNVRGAAVLCPPLDQERNAPVLGAEDSWVRRNVYTKNLLRQLKSLARERLDRFAGGDPDTQLFDYRGVESAQTITDFDTAYIARVYSYEDAYDYYRQNSCIHVLHRIAVPTLLLGAADDPFMDPQVWPEHLLLSSRGGHTAAPPPPLKFVRTSAGGHLGYCLHRVPPDDERLLLLVSSDDDYGDVVNGGQQQQQQRQCPGWACVESARFLQHVEQEVRNGDDDIA